MVARVPSRANGPVTTHQVRVTDIDYLVLLLQVARARGLSVVVLRRSRQSALLSGTEAEIDEAWETTQRLCVLLNLRRMEALRSLLQEDHLHVPSYLTRAIADTSAECGVPVVHGAAASAVAAPRNVQTN